MRKILLVSILLMFIVSVNGQFYKQFLGRNSFILTEKKLTYIELSQDSIPLIINSSNNSEYVLQYVILNYQPKDSLYTLTGTDTLQIKTVCDSVEYVVTTVADELFGIDHILTTSLNVDVYQTDGSIYWLEIPTGKLTEGNSIIYLDLYYIERRKRN